MGVHDAPQWLLSAFARSAAAAGATVPRPQIEAAASRLLERWADESRFHHNVKHLVDMLAKVDQLAEETHHPELVRLAAWYHGAVFSSAPSSAYAQRGGEDETASAELAAEELSALGVPEKSVTRIHDIITGLARHRDAIDVDTQALCDAELATLAVEPQRYAEYRRSIRKEYAHIPLRDYLTSRIAILTKLLARKNLFASPLGQHWEQPARQNLSAELQRLKDELARLPADDDGGLASLALTTEIPLVRMAPTGPGSPGPATTTGTMAPAAPARTGTGAPALTTTASGTFAAAPAGATSTGIPASSAVAGTNGSNGAAAVAAEPGADGAPAVAREPIIKRFEKTTGPSQKPDLPAGPDRPLRRPRPPSSLRSRALVREVERRLDLTTRALDLTNRAAGARVSGGRRVPFAGPTSGVPCVHRRSRRHLVH